jgi:Group II intron, maturase-specific domain
MGVGTQDVGQDDGVAGVGFAAADGVAFAVADRGERVDGIDGTPGGVQTGNQQAAAGLERHRDRLFRRVTVIGQHIHKLPIAGGVIADAPGLFLHAALPNRTCELAPHPALHKPLDLLGWRIQRHQKRGTNRHYVYNYPAKKALRSIKAKCKTICRMNVSLPLAVLLHQLNSVLRGWTAYFRAGVSARAFGYLRMIVRYSGGYGANIRTRGGRTCVAATATAHGGRGTERSCCSTPVR